MSAAKDPHWEQVRSAASRLNDPESNCILELLARINALEEALRQRAIPTTLTVPHKAEHMYVLDDGLVFDPRVLTLELPTGSITQLSPGEASLLLIFCAHAGKTISRADLMAACGSLADPAASRTIDIRVSNLRRKLGRMLEEEDIIKAHRGFGYKLMASVKPSVAYTS